MSSGAEASPFGCEPEDLRCRRHAGVDENTVGASLNVSGGPIKRLATTAARDERLGACDDAEVGIGVAVLASPDLAAELVNVSQRLVAVEERVRLRENFIFDANCGDAALA